MPTVGYRDNHPAVNVKDDRLYAWDTKARPMIEALGETRAEIIYQGVVDDFWQVWAKSIADDCGYGEVWSAGRSGGWLYADGADFDIEIDAERPIGPLDEYDTEQFELRDRFLKFAERIDAEVTFAQEQYVERLGEALEADAREALERSHWAARDVMTV